MSAITTTGYELADWQQRAVETWLPTKRGTLEIFTGGGKTKIALACLAEVSKHAPDLRVAVVVPTEALALQWVAALEADTSLQADEIGLLGAGKSHDFSKHRALVAVINSAAVHLPKLARTAQPLMLIVDECHRAGATTFARVLDTRAAFRLGLSATPERDEVDENGEPLVFDDQIVGQKLGPVVFRFTLKDAREVGWLPTFQIHHHGVELAPDERRDYEDISRRIDDLSDRMRELGMDPSASRRLAARGGDDGALAQAYVGLTSKRKDLLYRAKERSRVVQRLLRERMAGERKPRVLLFHERVSETEALFNDLSIAAEELGTGIRVGIEHSGLATRDRRAVLQGFRDGTVHVLVSVKSLVEGIDVPEADVGVSVASTSSVRQRIQALGRVLRKSRDPAAAEKVAEMHVVYVAETVDDLIYGKEDWSDLTGADANVYWRWPVNSSERRHEPGPPRTPRPTEEQAWAGLRPVFEAGETPVWPGMVPPQEYSVDTLGTVRNAQDAVIENPQGATEWVQRIRRRAGGRFYVTPVLKLVIVYGEDGRGGMEPCLAGKLHEPFRVRELGDALADQDGAVEPVDTSALQPGNPYPGPTDKSETYQVRTKRGGVIEKSLDSRNRVFAVDDGPGPKGENARQLVRAWRMAVNRGMEFYVNRLGHAWYLAEGEPRFLADVRDGFAWPEMPVE
jgi:superfamily II DNA or RNA helicase